MIGNVPHVDQINLVTGQDISHFFRVRDSDPFPEDTEVLLYIYDHTRTVQLGFWPAVAVTAAGAQFNIQHEELDSIPTGSRFRVYVKYAESFGRFCWYRGGITRSE
jgi:hypothetical protein